ncbi:MAG: hypothetical protein KJ941_13045 [Bacteroidetes bacterium]|nr:hypothetical protein [Bacteroidota bacterium]
MIKHSKVEELIHVSIENTDFSYRIPLQKLGKTIKWVIGKNETEGIALRNVSIWTLKLFTKNVTDLKYVEEFQEIMQHYVPKNSIDWNETLLALEVQNEYNKLKHSEMEESELISILENKFKIG